MINKDLTTEQFIIGSLSEFVKGQRKDTVFNRIQGIRDQCGSGCFKHGKTQKMRQIGRVPTWLGWLIFHRRTLSVRALKCNRRSSYNTRIARRRVCTCEPPTAASKRDNRALVPRRELTRKRKAELLRDPSNRPAVLPLSRDYHTYMWNRSPTCRTTSERPA